MIEKKVENAEESWMDGEPESPCTRVCTLDDDNVCLGCGRTLDEIVAWAGMSRSERRTVLRRLADRQ